MDRGISKLTSKAGDIYRDILPEATVRRWHEDEHMLAMFQSIKADKVPSAT